ncbi:hypothetical protein [Methylorubrum thiocyanatum]|uniref:Uncharacterized protein n=1 Tax=Methylorubrum thiocyanatum TaxID=47958 RepID=A0AA40VC51_9HYPH|nr:hypothetical protein [Methylorubrum thiocyanatum]MBA8914607.1 hypothetical protein [Methylorubrum thiocyanatum]GJE81980.1 hypothetical protein CJNNKLLH_3337 [Methylorubrum thiocyanatum]
MALRFGAKVAGRVEGRYLVAMDGDEFNRTVPWNDADVVEAVLPVPPTEDALGGLLGFRLG